MRIKTQMTLFAFMLFVAVHAQQTVENNKPQAGRVTEIRDEHVEVIDGRIEVINRVVRQTETRVIGQPSEKDVKSTKEAKSPGKKDEKVSAMAADAAVAAPSLDPPAAETADPKRVIRYFCRCWKDGDFKRMWWTMSPRYRLKAKYEEFCAVFVEDARFNGGLADENLEPDVQQDDGVVTLTVELRFKLRRVRPRKVKAVCELTKDGYRISESGIIPVDFDNL